VEELIGRCVVIWTRELEDLLGIDLWRRNEVCSDV
jgi:hypothetical protein